MLKKPGSPSELNTGSRGSLGQHLEIAKKSLKYIPHAADSSSFGGVSPSEYNPKAHLSRLLAQSKKSKNNNNTNNRRKSLHWHKKIAEKHGNKNHKNIGGKSPSEYNPKAHLSRLLAQSKKSKNNNNTIKHRKSLHWHQEIAEKHGNKNHKNIGGKSPSEISPKAHFARLMANSLEKPPIHNQQKKRENNAAEGVSRPLTLNGGRRRRKTKKHKRRTKRRTKHKRKTKHKTKRKTKHKRKRSKRGTKKRR
jgi:hypothetical protein